MNNSPTSILATFGGAIILLGMIVFLIITGHDPSQFVGYISIVLGVTGVGALLGNKVDKVQKQTNGTLTAKDQTIADQHQQIVSLQAALSAQATTNAPGTTVVDTTPQTPTPAPIPDASSTASVPADSQVTQTTAVNASDVTDVSNTMPATSTPTPDPAPETVTPTVPPAAL